MQQSRRAITAATLASLGFAFRAQGRQVELLLSEQSLGARPLLASARLAVRVRLREGCRRLPLVRVTNPNT